MEIDITVIEKSRKIIDLHDQVILINDKIEYIKSLGRKVQDDKTVEIGIFEKIIKDATGNTNTSNSEEDVDPELLDYVNKLKEVLGQQFGKDNVSMTNFRPGKKSSPKDEPLFTALDFLNKDQKIMLFINIIKMLEAERSVILTELKIQCL